MSENTDQNGQGSETEDVYSDCYSTFSQVTSTTINDIDQLPYDLNLRNVITLLGATVGGLLFGYDTGVISGVLINLKPSDLHRSILTDWNKEVITSSTSVGSFFGSIVAFPMADRYGRKLTLSICCVIFIIASFWMGLAMNLYWLIMGRFIVGLAVGIAAQCVPIYLTEISPAKIRGTILTLNSIAITGGQLIAYLMAFGFNYWGVNHSWRFLFILSSIPAILFILTLDFIPESPRWLIVQNRYKDALSVLKVIYPKATTYQLNVTLKKIVSDLNVIHKYQDRPQLNKVTLPHSRSNRNSVYDHLVTNIISHNRSVSFSNNTSNDLTPIQSGAENERHKKQRHKMEGRAKRALFVGCTLMFFQQITGFNAFMYYSPIIFQRFDSINDPLLPAIIVAATNFLFTFFALKFVDTWGRRSILLYTVWIMTTGLVLSTMGFARNDLTILVTSIIIFVAGYASGMGTVPWASVEFLPLNRRSFGASCISCTNWLTNTVVSMTFLTLLNNIGNEDSMLIFAMFTILAWLFVYFFYPEVKGLTLEEIGKVYENGIDVHYIYRNYY